jgi:HrpA-like RNA helicase
MCKLTFSRIPQALEKAGFELRRKNQKVVFTHITTEQFTERIKSEMNLSGREFAYKIRFDTSDTQKFLMTMTGGILVAELGDDPKLKEYGVLIIDEIHQKNRRN